MAGLINPQTLSNSINSAQPKKKSQAQIYADQADKAPTTQSKTQQKKPKQGFLGKFVGGTKDFLSPVKDTAVNTAKTAGNIASIPYDVGKTIPASITNNKKALKNATDKSNKNIGKAANFARFLPRAVVQLGESAPIINKHPSENNKAVTDKAPGVVKAVLGKEPIPSIQKVYKDTKKESGTAKAAGTAAVTLGGDLLAVKGGVEGVKNPVETAKVATGKNKPTSDLIKNTKTSNALSNLTARQKQIPVKDISEPTNELERMAQEQSAKQDKVAVADLPKSEELPKLSSELPSKSQKPLLPPEEHQKETTKLSQEYDKAIEEVKTKPTLTQKAEKDKVDKEFQTAQNKLDQSAGNQVTFPDRIDENTAPITTNSTVPDNSEINPNTQSTETSTANGTSKDIKTTSRVYERMKEEHPDILKDDLTREAITMKDDAEKAVSLLATDKQKAFEVAMGKEPSKDVTSASTNIAMSQKALEEGNHKLYNRLIVSRSLAQTRRGQELNAEKGSITDNSTDRYIKELLHNKMENASKKYLSGIDFGKKKSVVTLVTKQVDKEVGKIERQIKSRRLDTKTALQLLDKMECL